MISFPLGPKTAARTVCLLCAGFVLGAGSTRQGTSQPDGPCPQEADMLLGVRVYLFLFARAALTKGHEPGGWNSRNLSSYSSGG